MLQAQTNQKRIMMGFRLQEHTDRKYIYKEWIYKGYNDVVYRINSMYTKNEMTWLCFINRSQSSKTVCYWIQTLHIKGW